MMVAPALCTGCSGWFSRMARLFQVFQTFQGFPHCSKWSQRDPEGSRLFRTGFGWSGCTSMQLDVTGGVWTSGRHVWAVPEHLVLGTCWLAGQSCRRQVSVAHSRSRIEVVGVREQLGGQGDSALRYVSFMGWVVPFRIPLMRSMICIHG